jgi:hypothetical protein
VFQRSSSNVEGRNGYLSLRSHELRGLDHPRKRACLTAVHNFLLTRSDGTTAAERFFGQKPRSMFAAVLASVEIPLLPSVLRDEPWASLKECRVADAMIEAGTSNLARMRKMGSMGKPARHPDPALYMRVRLVDEADCDVPVGQVGEVLLHSPALMVGYYRDPERTADAMRGGCGGRKRGHPGARRAQRR